MNKLLIDEFKPVQEKSKLRRIIDFLTLSNLKGMSGADFLALIKKKVGDGVDFKTLIPSLKEVWKDVREKFA